MPNGGSDCCGTCWFNSRNKGQTGYLHARSLEPAVCSIRSFSIDNPFYTYCGNHPHRRPERDPVPVGPVYTGDSTGRRTCLKASPDTEAIRQHLLNLLGQLEEHPIAEDLLGIGRVVAWQLGEFEEVRAVDKLRRLATFDDNRTGDDSSGRFLRDLAETAIEALGKIERYPI